MQQELKKKVLKISIFFF